MATPNFVRAFMGAVPIPRRDIQWYGTDSVLSEVSLGRSILLNPHPDLLEGKREFIQRHTDENVTSNSLYCGDDTVRWSRVWMVLQ